MKAQARKRRKPPHRSDTEKASAGATRPAGAKKNNLPELKPVNVSDGIPDRVENPSRSRLVLVVFVFALWVSFLIYCLLMSRANNGAM